MAFDLRSKDKTERRGAKQIKFDSSSKRRETKTAQHSTDSHVISIPIILVIVPNNCKNYSIVVTKLTTLRTTEHPRQPLTLPSRVLKMVVSLNPWLQILIDDHDHGETERDTVRTDFEDEVQLLHEAFGSTEDLKGWIGTYHLQPIAFAIPSKKEGEIHLLHHLTGVKDPVRGRDWAGLQGFSVRAPWRTFSSEAASRSLVNQKASRKVRNIIVPNLTELVEEKEFSEAQDDGG